MILNNIETHLHFSGVISVNFVWDIIKKHNLRHLALNINQVYDALTFRQDEPYDFHRFLNKFVLLDEIPWDEEIIDASVADVCTTLDSENIDYAWIDISINKYMYIGWHKTEAIQFIYNSFEKYRPGQVGLILALKYEAPRASQEQYMQLIEHEIANKCLIGIDLVGDEAYYSGNFYAPLFKEWKKAGKITRAHVGESQCAQNVKSAIDDLHVTNIAHGLKAVENHDIMQSAIDNDITFDMALTSNYVTGVIDTSMRHPILDILRYGCKVTISSDDMTQLQTSLSNEFKLAASIGITNEEIYRIKQTAIDNTKKLLNV